VKASEVASSVVRSHSALDVINGSGFLFKTIGKVLATSKVNCWSCCRQRRRQRGRPKGVQGMPQAISRLR